MFSSAGRADCGFSRQKAKHLGTLHGPEHPHNMAWGDADRQTLYLTAQTGIYRIRLNNPGAVAFARR